MCKSDPQIAVAVTLMIASRGLRMTGSGTVSTWIFSVPCQQTARMWLLNGERRSGNFTGFEQLLEAPEILSNGVRRLAAEERCDQRSGPARRRGVLQVDSDFCAAAGSCLTEIYRAGAHDVRSRE